MPNDSSPSGEAKTCSAETVRENLLRFLRLIAKDVVRRLANRDAGNGTRAKESNASRQKS